MTNNAFLDGVMQRWMS